MIKLGVLVHGIYSKIQITNLLVDKDGPEGSLKEIHVLILEVIDEHGHIHLSDLASFFPNCKASTFQYNVDKLLWQEKGYINKSICRKDPRSRYFSLTEKGTEVLQSIRKHQQRKYGDLLRKIKLTKEEETVLKNVLQRTLVSLLKRKGYKKLS